MATEAAGSSKDNINQGHGTTENRADTPIQKVFQLLSLFFSCFVQTVFCVFVFMT